MKPYKRHDWRLMGFVFLAAVGLALLAPVSQAQAVDVTVTVTGAAVPDGTVTVEAAVDVGSIDTIAWTQVGGVSASISSLSANPTDVTLGAETAYKDELFHVLAEPPVGPGELPPTVPLPPGEFPAGLQDRFQVVGLNPFALEEAGLVTLHVEVTTNLGESAEAEVEIHTALPWKVKSDIRNVATGIPVLLHGKDQASYDWALTPPGGSAAALMDATAQNPEFTPDVSGLYEVTVTDEATGDPVILAVYAGTWRGVIVGQDLDGRPVSDPSCTGCHNPGSIFAPDKFTPWAQTGHAEIFTDLLNNNTHYNPGCFACHTVGYDVEVGNGGSDDASDYGAFLASGLLGAGDPTAWTQTLANFPETAQLANIQCENCHGPQNSAAHMQVGSSAISGDSARSSISADVCAVCHGEPLRHARFQQWQLSPHADYELAIEEGGSGNCSRCHTGNGFLTWLPILLGDEPGDPTASIEVSWTEDAIHPQTCATCHDPHQIGTTSGNNTNATVRVSDDTPLLIAGFQAFDVGRGAMCMTCHNTRRGLRNDDVPLTDPTRAPHGGAQGDMVMGQNAYLVELGEIDPVLGFPPGDPGSHASLQDTCATCHMEATPPPDVLSYNQSGTNHTFFASPEICSECHGFTADAVQGPVATSLDTLQGLIEEALLALITELTEAGNIVNLNDQAIISSRNVGDVEEIVFGETRGRQAINVIFTDGTETGLLRVSDIDVVERVTLCHNGRRTLVLNASATAAHLRHGDTLGACPGDDASAPLGQLYDFADTTLIKAGWNWNLVHNDGSLGVHNPLFASNVLAASIAALSML